MNSFVSWPVTRAKSVNSLRNWHQVAVESGFVLLSYSLMLCCLFDVISRHVVLKGLLNMLTMCFDLDIGLTSLDRFLQIMQKMY